MHICGRLRSVAWAAFILSVSRDRGDDAIDFHERHAGLSLRLTFGFAEQSNVKILSAVLDLPFM